MVDREASRSNWMHRLALAGIIALALALRFYRLDTQSLWNDEGTSVVLAQRGLATITRLASQDIHPPLYYYLLHFWIALWGNSELAVRALSALVGTALVGLTYRLGRRWLDPRLALVAALLSAVSPFQIYYSQEARMYIMVSLFGALSMWLYDHWLRHAGLLDGERSTTLPLWERWAVRIGYLVASLAAVYSHYFAFSVALAQNVGFVVWASALVRIPWLNKSASHRRDAWRLWGEWALLQAIVVLGYVPWLLLSWHSLSSWPAVSGSLSLGGLLIRVATDFTLGMTRADIAGTAARFAVGAHVLLALLGHWPRGRRGTNRRYPLQALLYLWVPIATLFALSLQRPMYKPKFLLLATPAYYLLIARGVGHVAEWLERVARSRAHGAPLHLIGVATRVALCLVLIGLVMPSCANLYWDATTYRDDYRGIVAYIEATASPGDAILINAPSQIETVAYYYQGELPMVPLPRKRPPEREPTEAELAQLAEAHGRLYCIFWATDESDRERIMESWLDSHCFKAMDSWFGNVRLVVYATSDPDASASDASIQDAGTIWGDRIELTGYSLLTPEPCSGDILRLALHWQALAPIEDRFKVFVHLIDGRGNIVGQRDSEPGGGAQPTIAWPVGEDIVDNHGLVVRPASPPGPHTLRIGLYDAENGTRLPITAGSSAGDDALDLAEIALQAPNTPPPLGALDIQIHEEACWEGLCLLGYRWHLLGSDHAPSAPIHPGDAVSLVMFWQREKGQVGESVAVSLMGTGGREAWRVDLLIAEGAEPVAVWRSGTIVRDMHVLHLPSDLAAGRYGLVLSPDWAEGGTLGRVTISPR